MSDISLSTHAFDGGFALTPLTFYFSKNIANPSLHVKQYYDINKESFPNAKEFVDKFLPRVLEMGYKIEYVHTDYEMEEISSHKVIMYNEDHDIVFALNTYRQLDTYCDFLTCDASQEYFIERTRKVLGEEAAKYQVEKDENLSYIHFICRNSDGYYTQEFEVSDGLDFEHIFDSYEETFKEEFSDVVISKLADVKCTKGIVLLHGAPGTGKTTYLRYLLSKIKDKKVMYLPPELGHSLSDPSFITFLMHNPNSILCIEDAENIIKTREAGGNQAVSNILNITDGILGTALKYQVICTFNAPFTEIDSALTRKGRMIGEHHFTALSKERTNFLIKKLYKGDIAPSDEGMTLAEIHALEEYVPKTETKKRSIGFTA